MTFALDPRLAADTLEIGDFSLSRVRLMNDARFPWLILVPRRASLTEIVDLDRRERVVLMEEIALASEALMSTRSMSVRSAISCGSCTSISSRAGSATLRGRGRSGARGWRSAMKTAPLLS